MVGLAIGLPLKMFLASNLTSSSCQGMTSGYLPLGACIVSDRVMERMVNANDAALFSAGYTYSAHPVCCAAALKNIEIMEQNIFWSMCATFPLISKHVFRLWPIFPVLEMCAAWDCWAVSKARPTQTARHWKRNASWGLCWMLPAKTRASGAPLINMAVFSPPLIITRTEIDVMFAILEEALKEVEELYIRGN